jgi:hypothetical protein
MSIGVRELAGRSAPREVVVLDAVEHDRAVAAISHLPLVVAARARRERSPGHRTTNGPSWPLAERLAARAGGRARPAWPAATRPWVPRSAVTNAPILASRIRDLQGVLDGWLAELERADGPDERALAERLGHGPARCSSAADDAASRSASSLCLASRCRGLRLVRLRTDGARGVRSAVEHAGTLRAAGPAMERDPRFKQIIPYLVLRDGPRWFLMQRTAAGGDERLSSPLFDRRRRPLNPA